MTKGGWQRLTFVGVATYDALALVEQFPGADERVEATELTYAGGGPAATAAVVAARLGHDSAFVGAVGADEEGEKILAGLRHEGVDTSGVRVVAGARSAASVVVVSAARSTRAICNRPFPLADRIDRQALAGALQESAWVHMDHAAWAPTMAVTVAEVRQARLSLDAGHPIADFTCADLDLYVPTVEALQKRYGAAPIESLLATARLEGAGTVVATDGSDGAYGFGEADEFCHLPSFPTSVVSTLGAGDVFHGALVCGFAEGRELPDAIRRANAVAALSCRALDGRSAVPTAAELDAFLTSAAASTSTERTFQ